MTKPIYVTEPFLPPLDDVVKRMEKIWASKHVTNNGPFLREFEKALEEYLEVENVTVFANATLGLVAALTALDLKGEVITTPYTFVATANSIVWSHLTPVFVDIDPITFNIDPKKIESAITEKTSAILPVHVYGRPCDTEAIRQIANKNNLKIIYDAAHAFGAKSKGRSLVSHGDISIVSMHATKVMNTFEGGIVISKSKDLSKHISRLRNFGFVNETTVEAVGINCKMNEFQAALGLEQLKHIDHCISKRREVYDRYCSDLVGITGLSIPELLIKPDEHNYPYFPIIVNDNFSLSRDELYTVLKKQEIYTRRYFYPLVSEFPMYKKSNSSNYFDLCNALNLSHKVLCLPIYPDLSLLDQNRIIDIIKENLS